MERHAFSNGFACRSIERHAFSSGSARRLCIFSGKCMSFYRTTSTEQACSIIIRRRAFTCGSIVERHGFSAEVG